jgi:acyl-CoA thioester hydrolase
LSNPRPIFTHAIRILPRDIDAMGHVNNVVYLQWVQDAAAAHWNHLTTHEINNDVRWVVLRHQIEYKQEVLQHHEVEARTWVANAEGVKSDRVVQIVNLSTGKIAAEALTTWCLLDAKTLRPRRIDEEIAKTLGCLKG